MPLTLFSEIKAVYSMNRTKHQHVLCGQSAEMFVLKTVSTCGNHKTLNGKTKVNNSKKKSSSSTKKNW